MPIVTQESLETLRDRVDLFEVLKDHVTLKPAGSVYKACCPFHDEKTPSFVLGKGSKHYHCFGCGARGDAIQFLIDHLHFTFADAVESLSKRFGVTLHYEKQSKEKTESKTQYKAVLHQAHEFYRFCLWHTEEGREALAYLYRRGLTLQFIQQFHLGYVLKSSTFFLRYMQEKGVPFELLETVGVLRRDRQGKWREWFSERIVFPVCDLFEQVIGFSGRKYRQATFGGKYINTIETPLFKKSRILYGLSLCRKQIVKKKRACIVEGQIDALRLIDQGWDYTVAALGTAFGQGHVEELVKLGVEEVDLLFDGDRAGKEAAKKVGDAFQKCGIGVFVLCLPEQSDPDTILSNDGKEQMQQFFDEKIPYISFLVHFLSEQYPIHTSTGKGRLVKVLSEQIAQWDSSVVVHESLKEVAKLLSLPEESVLSSEHYAPRAARIETKQESSLASQMVNGDYVVEVDCLRWLLLMTEEQPLFFQLAEKNLKAEHFSTPLCREVYAQYLAQGKESRPLSLLQLGDLLQTSEGSILVSEILRKQIDRSKAVSLLVKTMQTLLDLSNWRKRQAITAQLRNKQCSKREEKELAKEFDVLLKQRPEVQLVDGIEMK